MSNTGLPKPPPSPLAEGSRLERAPRDVEKGFRKQMAEATGYEVRPGHWAIYRLGRCTITVAREPVDLGEPTDQAGLRWHLAISHPFRLPTWNEVRMARDELLPDDVHFVIPHPAREYWMSLHPNCLHLWESRDWQLNEQMEFEGTGLPPEARGPTDSQGRPL